MPEASPKLPDISTLKLKGNPPRKTPGYGIPETQVLIFRDKECRKISLSVLIDPELIGQISLNLATDTPEVGLNMIDHHADVIRDIFAQAFLEAIYSGDKSQTIAIDVTGYKQP